MTGDQEAAFRLWLRRAARSGVRPIVMPAYAVGLACLTVVALLVLTLVGSIEIADRNAADLLRRYEADKQATAEQNKAVTCALFSSQLDAFADAESDVGRKSYQAWLGVYRLARCSPERN